MGLIKAAMGALGGTLRDQYKEFIVCDALPVEVLMRKGQSAHYAGGSNNGNDNVITDGSRVVVNVGQCILIVEDGKVIDFSAEPGEYIWNTGTAPSVLTGGMEGLKKSLGTVVERFKAGGQQEHDQRVYYVNLKEIMGNKIGEGRIPFRDGEFNFTIQLQYFGNFSFKITNPVMFYTTVCANVPYEFKLTDNNFADQFKGEVKQAMQSALSTLSDKGLSYEKIGQHTKELTDSLNAILTKEWVDLRGISVVSFALDSVKPDADSAKKIEQFQESKIYGSNVNMMAARMGTAQANAMESAAKNEAGAMTGFMGMGFAQQAGGMNAGQLFQMGQQQQQPAPTSAPAPQPAPQASGWTCECGTVNTHKFCSECGKPQPVPANTWTCECGKADNAGKFCAECGKSRPPELDSVCEACGYQGTSPFKFCPQCGAVNK